MRWLDDNGWPAWVAGRYLRTTRQDSFVRFLSWTAGLGIALGVGALILALAAMTGLQDAIRRSAAQGVDVARVRLDDPAQVAAVAETLRRVVAAERLSTVVEGNAWLVTDGSVRPVRVRGYRGLRAVMPGGPALGPPEPGRVRLVGFEFGLERDEVVELATARPRVGPLGSEPTVVRVRVDSWAVGEPTAVLALETAQRLLGSRGVEVAVNPSGEPEPHLAAQIEDALVGFPGVSVHGWQDLEPGLWLALRLEKVLVFVAVFLIVLVAVLALVADLYLLIADRRREVGILQALGAGAGGVRRSFQRFGTTIATAGALAGAFVGVSLAWVLDRTGWIRLPGEGYLLEHVPFTVRPLDVLVVTASSLLLAWLVSRLATSGIGSSHPAEVLRR